ncbi:hypothetical protein Scep_008884 [Stephania cephalantha]|uniref:CG-1 domain-containing protein n=1 Tax=Stephania cephalantha TaxID=152367 RepID=A0AAP0JTJ3_9MAGN
MASGGPVALAGSEIHGFHTIGDLDFAKMMEEAHTRWLRPNEIHALLYNYTLFNIRVKPMHLPTSGAILLFDRKMLRNFRKDGHNWKKKKDGKTVKEAHEHLKVGNEERIHVYYAHGDDNPTFVRRCYWLLDKKYEHIVLVHYRETSEKQGSPVTPVNSNSSSGHSDTAISQGLVEETDTAADNAFCLDSSTSSMNEVIGDKMAMRNYEKSLHEINTLDWEDLLASNDQNNYIAAGKDNTACLDEQDLSAMNDSHGNGSLLLLKSSGPNSPFAQSTSQIINNGSFDMQNKEVGVNTGENCEMSSLMHDSLHTQDSFGRWMTSIMVDSPSQLDNIPVQSPISTGHESTTSVLTEHHQVSSDDYFFSINDISPAWAFSTEETKVIVVGNFNREYPLHLISDLCFVFGDVCVPAEEVQIGVFRCKALPHAPGLLTFYLTRDGYTPISQVMTFEYRALPIENSLGSSEEKSKWEDFQVQLRLSRLLFSSTNTLNVLSSEVSPSALKEAKKFAVSSSIDKDWAYLIKSIGNRQISYPEAKNSLFEITLKNKLQEWLLGRLIEGGKTAARDRQGQGILHLCAILGYTWAVRPYSLSGLSLDFRDSHGWTALHWAAYCGREKMVAVLLSAGADPSLVSDPTSEFPGGCTAADLASKYGFEGLAAYLAEKGLTEHFKRMSLSGNVSGSLQASAVDLANHGHLSEEDQLLKDSLVAYRTAADAAARIQDAFRVNSLRKRTKAAEALNPEAEARSIVAALKIQHAFRNYEARKRMAAAARIQYRFRSWKIRKEFLNKRRQAIKIQAAFRAHQARRQYRKILWSVGVLEKAILRWRQRRKGFRGLQVETTEMVVVEPKQEEDAEEDFFRISRKQAEDRIDRSVTKVQALFRSRRAQQEYQRMKMAYCQAQLEELLEPDCGD